MASIIPNQPSGPHAVGEHIIPPPRPSSPATAEYRLDHSMVRIKGPEKSLKFYCDCTGLHVVFIFNAGPCRIYDLGPRDAGTATLGISKGLLKLYHIPTDASTPYTNVDDYPAPSVKFGHIGFTVPNVSETLDRVKTFGYEIIKLLDEAKVEQMGLRDEVVQGKQGEVAEGCKHVFKQLAFIVNPDGYWVEIVPKS